MNIFDIVTAIVITSVISALNCVFFILQNLSYNKDQNQKTPNSKIVVITGCDSGFGLLTAEKLSRLGYKVVAICLTDQGVDRLKELVSCALKCDVTKESDVAKAAADVKTFSKSQREKVYAVVNNAGILALGAVEWCPLDTYKRVLGVNFFGAVAITKAMLPLLKENRGSRYIYVSSVAGMHSTALGSAYFASKHALEGFTKSFRQEMRPWGVHVCNVNPSFTRTPLTSGLKQMSIDSFRKAPEEVSSQYDESFMDVFDTYLDPILEEPGPVVDTICDLVSTTHPEMWNFPSIQSKILRNLCNVTSPVLDFAQIFLTSFVPQPKPDVMRKLQQ